ncbi:MAG: hypothetical protein ACREOO_18705 [bacterium]
MSVAMFGLLNSLYLSFMLAKSLLVPLAAAWDEPQRFGFFKKASIAGDSDSVWVVGTSAGMDYPAFLFTNNKWQSLELIQATRHTSVPVIQPLEGGIEVILKNGSSYSLHPENDRIHIRLTEKFKAYYESPSYSQSDPIAGLNSVQVLSAEDERILIHATIALQQLDDLTRSRYQTQLHAVNSAREEFSAQIVAFDLISKAWHYFPSPPFKGALTCGALTNKQIWLGSAYFSEMGTPLGGAGVAVFDLATQRYTILTSKNSGLLDDGAISIRQSGESIWMVSISGIQKYNLASQKWTRFKINPDVELRRSAEVVLIRNGSPVENLSVGAKVHASTVFTGMVSVSLQTPIVGWTKSSDRIKRIMHQESGAWKVALGSNETIYTDRSTSSPPLAVFGGAETNTEAEIIEQGEEWLKVRIVYGWIPADAVLPLVVEVD